MKKAILAKPVFVLQTKRSICMKKFIAVFGLICVAFLLYGQNTTNNNTIIIQGNVYYFQPSTTQSSPLPSVGNSDFIGDGSWYGENAARAWASISGWAVERCKNSTQSVTAQRGERVYISQVHAYRTGSPEIERFFLNAVVRPSKYGHDIGGIIIYYWIVYPGERMEDGRRATRTFIF